MFEKPLAIACAALLALSGFLYVRMSSAILDLAQYREDVAQNTQKAESEAHAKEQAMRNQVERIAKNAANQQAELATRVAGTASVAASLRNEIARLNASEATTSTNVAAIAGQASIARELLGSCTEEYRDVAQRADELRDQVTGLQDYAMSVCKP